MQSLDEKKLISSEKIFPIKQGKPISMSRWFVNIADMEPCYINLYVKLESYRQEKFYKNLLCINYFNNINFSKKTKLSTFKIQLEMIYMHELIRSFNIIKTIL